MPTEDTLASAGAARPLRHDCNRPVSPDLIWSPDEHGGPEIGRLPVARGRQGFVQMHNRERMGTWTRVARRLGPDADRLVSATIGQ